MRRLSMVALSIVLVLPAMGWVLPSSSAAPGAGCRLATSGNRHDCDVVLETSLSSLPPPPSVFGVARLTLAPGATFPDLVVPGPSVLMVESGRLVVDITGETDEDEELEEMESRVRHRSASGTPETSTDAVTIASPGVFRITLKPGDQLSVLPDWPHMMRNDGTGPAVVVAIAITPPEPSAGGPPWPPAAASPMELPAGVSLESLDVGYRMEATFPPADSLDVRMERYAVLPAETLSIASADGVRLLTVESGAIGVSTDAEVLVRTSQGEDFGRSGDFNLSTGDRALIDDGVDATIRGSDAPAVVLLVGADAAKPGVTPVH